MYWYVEPRLRPSPVPIDKVPLPGSLMHDALLPRVKELLGLLVAASGRRSSTPRRLSASAGPRSAARERDENVAWWNCPAPPEEELWLFVDTVTGLLVKPEMHNERIDPGVDAVPAPESPQQRAGRH